MVPTLLADAPPLLMRHQSVGCSTGFMEQRRGDWPALEALTGSGTTS